ncbi:MAG: GtrA family protein [Clostridia bacterium]
MKHFFNRGMLIFLAIGVGNTLLSQLIMQLIYAWGGYWLSSAIAFALTSVISYILNKRFSFENKDSVKDTAWRFALVIGACYVLAYLIAQPATAWGLGLLGAKWPAIGALPVERIALLTGQVLFTGMNYLGQRFFAFRQKAA